MKHTNLSLFGVAGGLFLTLGVWFRYFILFPDSDKALFFGMIGLLIIVASWNYAGRVELDKENKKQDIRIQCIEEFIQDEVVKK